MAGRAATLTVKVLADASQATKELDKTSGKVGKWQSGLNKASLAAGAGLAVLGTAALSSAKAASEDAAAADQLALALKKNAGATDEGVASAEDWISSTSRATAVADDELRPALATLARATGNVEDSQDALALALDISAATGKDVQSVSTALAKGYAGNTTALGKLVPGLDKATLASKDMTKITAELADKTGGAAAKAAKSTAGQMKNMQIQMGEAQEEMGKALLPAMSAFAKIGATVAMWAGKNAGLIKILAAVFAVLAGAVLATNAATKVWTASTKIASAATKAWTAIQWLLNAALNANPIGLVVAAVLALVAAVVLLWKKNEAFRRIVLKVWEVVLGAIRAVFGWVKKNWPLLLGILTGPIGLAVALIIKHRDKILAALRVVWDWIKRTWQTVKELLSAPFRLWLAYVKEVIKLAKGVLQTVIDWVKTTWATLTDLIKKPIQAAWDGIKSILDTMASVWDDVFGGILDAIDKVADALDKVKSGAGKVIDFINPFSVAPPAPVAAISPAAFAAPRLATGRRASSRSSGRSVVVNVSGAIDPQQTARTIQKVLRDADVRAGRRRFA